jgi:hypothetical protein
MKMKEVGEGEIPAGVFVISFIRRKETEAYVNNLAKLLKGLYIIDHILKKRFEGGAGWAAQNQEHDNAGRAKKK